ncbi:MAG TPA: glycosyltransferase family 4 protein [Rubellimicrobium sp.]|nr:glycosyltransferase family 4 protein [Rubellimicrobium sp.]
MRIVRPWGYPARFNTPRWSRHQIETRRWLPVHRIWSPLESVLLMPTHGADLIATFNRIPLGRRPFTISFESHLPRLFGYESSRAFERLTASLAGERCRRIIPISHWARRMFLGQHRGGPYEDVLDRKSAQVIYPAVEVPDEVPVRESHEGLRVFFVGGHFSRKGGPAVLLAAQEAARRKLPIEFHIVSNLTVGRGNGVWTDPPDPGFFAEDFRRLDLPNVIAHGAKPNAEVINLLRSSDVSVLPTLSDTFGFSVLESLASGVPVIGTRANALPEIISDRRTGRLLELDTDANGEWTHLFKMDTASPEYGALFRWTMEDLSRQLLASLEEMLDTPQDLDRMKVAAHADAAERFNARLHSALLDDLYEEVV